MEVLAIGVAAAAIALAWSARRHANRLAGQNAALAQNLAELMARLTALEGRASPWKSPEPPFPVAAEPVPVAPPLPPTPAVAPLPAAAAEPAPDLKAVIGSNWLSKLGVLILLIGLALFHGFSLTTMGPAGRIAVGSATTLTLLGTGVAAERRTSYRVLGAALLGGGSAALYFTVYAAHALPAARVVESPFLGFLLLLGVSAGMVAHSLRYDSPTITGLAFAAAFVSIALSPQNQFARLSSIPLLLSLVVVAWRKNGQSLAAAGAAYAYFTFALSLATGDGDTNITRFGQPILWTYWLLLEAFDRANLRRGIAYFPVFLFNATGFLLVSTATWLGASLGSPDLLLVAIAAAHLLSSLLRLERRPEGAATPNPPALAAFAPP
ncbi:MAG: DUF2339 domain-containing protein [Acidobacteria bacterium]|nr:DUF2339 domain-containing protein [Acidobacteriota bacterium]